MIWERGLESWSMDEIPRPFNSFVGRVCFCGWVALTCRSKGMSSSELESITFSADLILEVSLVTDLGFDVFDVLEIGFSGVLLVDVVFGVTFVAFFLDVMIAPPTFRTGFITSSSAGRLAGTLARMTGESTGTGVIANGRVSSPVSLALVLFLGISDILGSGSTTGRRASISVCFFSTMSRSLEV